MDYCALPLISLVSGAFGGGLLYYFSMTCYVAPHDKVGNLTTTAELPASELSLCVVMTILTSIFCIVSLCSCCACLELACVAEMKRWTRKENDTDVP